MHALRLFLEHLVWVGTVAPSKVPTRHEHLGAPASLMAMLVSVSRYLSSDGNYGQPWAATNHHWQRHQ